MSTNETGGRTLVIRSQEEDQGNSENSVKEAEFKRSLENGLGWQRRLREENHKLMSLN